jgi:HK97 family phage portal protein
LSVLSSIGSTLRRMTGIVFRRSTYRIFSQPGSNFDYLSAVGDGTGSSTVAAPLRWIARTFPEAPPALWETMENGQEEQVRNHPMLRLLTRPNSFYTGPQLWMATVTDWNVDGNAYWLKLRNGGGMVKALWWIPHWLIEPVGTDTVFIDHYRYSPGVEQLRIDKDDIVHFRNGLDAEDPKLGSSPLKSVLREVFTDDQAAAFTASLLTNMGVPGLVISPEKGTTLDEASGLEVKKYVNEKFTGDRRGEALVMTGATQIAQFGFSPEQLVLKDLRRIPEERVTAVLGVPAIVAGLGAGLDRSTFTNAVEARATAYESGLIPTQRIMSEDIRFQLLNEYVSDPFLWRFGFDLSKVSVFRAAQLQEARRWDLMYRGGWAMRSEARRGLGLPIDEARDNVYLQPLNTTVIAASDGVELPPAPEQAQLSELGRQMLEIEQKTSAGIEDVKAVVREFRPPEPVVQPPTEVHFHEGAFTPPPSAYIHVEPTPVTVEPTPITVLPTPVTVNVPKADRPRKALARRTAEGDIEVTYPDDPPELELVSVSAVNGNGSVHTYETET